MDRFGGEDSVSDLVIAITGSLTGLCVGLFYYTRKYPMLSYSPGKNCTSAICTVRWDPITETRTCVSSHCANCHEPSSYQGHTRKDDKGALVFVCEQRDSPGE